VYDLLGSYEVRAVKLVCKCRHETVYTEQDLLDDKLFKFGNTYLTYALLIEFDLAVQYGGLPSYAFWQTREEMYALNPEKPGLFLSHNQWQAVWWAWMQSCTAGLDTDSLFTCPLCARLPAKDRQWTFDGMCMGIQSSKLNITLPVDCLSSEQRTTINKYAAFMLRCFVYCAFWSRSVSNRVVIQSAELRNALRGYAEGDAKSPTSLTGLRSIKAKADELWFHPLLDYIVSLSENADTRYEERCPDFLKRLLRSISMTTPVSGFILNGPVMKDVLEELAKGTAARGSLRIMSQLIDSCPCLADLLASPACRDSCIPTGLRPLLKHLANIVNKFYEGKLNLRICC
jgi:hypothetical protein